MIFRDTYRIKKKQMDPTAFYLWIVETLDDNPPFEDTLPKHMEHVQLKGTVLCE